MTATLCPWTSDCLPEHPLNVGLALFLIAFVVALAIYDYFTGDD